MKCALLMNAAAISLNLLPPALVEKARAVKRIPFLVAGAAAVLVAIVLSWLGENRLQDVAAAETEAVQARNNQLRQLESKLKAAQTQAAAELEKCDAFQQLMASRFSALQGVDAVRRSLLPGMWITAWEQVPVKASEDDEKPIAPVRVTIRGWRDTLSAQEAKHREANAGKKMTAEEIVAATLKTKSNVVADSVKVVSQKDVNSKGVLSEFAIELKFAPPPSVNPDAAKKKSGKKRNRKGGRR